MRSHAALADLAERQHGVVTAAQLCGLGLSGAAVGRMARARRLHRVHRGVYAVGHRALPKRGRCQAAVLACGSGAVLSHAAAAWLWGLAPSLPAVVDVTVPSHGQRRQDIALHHSSTLTAAEHGTLAGIPVTDWPRTLLDVAAGGRRRQLDDAIERAERLGILDLAAIDAMLRRRSGNRGAARLRLATEIYREPVFSRARSERLLLATVKAAGLPRPAINSWVGKFEIDAYWEAERFAVEVDGWEAHRTRKAFEKDHLRWEEMKLAGIEVIPISARRIETRSAEVGRHLRDLLDRRREQLGIRPR
ncbi:MAG: type IV toxin-antitoxin system AbiEi family antitoxin domain-containing protein [Syntrophothermus sp.]